MKWILNSRANIIFESYNKYKKKEKMFSQNHKYNYKSNKNRNCYRF